MATQIENTNNPSFILLPYINNRTAWRDIGFPAILVIPNVRDGLGAPIDNSQVSNVRIQIEDVPRQSKVAGHDHVGLIYPDRELFAREISDLELSHRYINLVDYDFYSEDGTSVEYENAVNGDYFEYTTASGLIERIQYLKSADYYDLSDITVETISLPSAEYIITYNATYFVRATVGGETGQLLCIDTSRTAIAATRVPINHPGEVLEDVYRHTPAPYVTSANKSEDTTVDFYRPLTDALQDLFDEQWFLEKLNHPSEVLPQHLPYLSYLLGFDMPYFPQSLDSLRRTMLQNVVKLSRLKGSKRAITELFELFGYNILIANLWWSSDGKKLIRPGQSLGPDYADQEITIEQEVQLEPLLSDYDVSGFGDLDIPLLYRPQNAEFIGDFLSTVGDTSVDVISYLAAVDSDAHAELLALTETITDNFATYGIDNTISITSSGVIGSSTIRITTSANSISSVSVLSSDKIAPILENGVSYDRHFNKLNLKFAQHLDLDNNRLFVFASYNKTNIIIPEILKDLRSNKFDIQLLTKDGNQVSPDIIDFLINFLFKIKAFHSLLNSIRLDLTLSETYEVTDWSVGGDVSQRYDMDAGKLQVPPAIKPTITEGDCIRDPESLGYKPEDIALRNRKLADLAIEHAGWKALDGRDTSGNQDTTIASNVGDDSRSECVFNYNGQDRITLDDRQEVDDVIYVPGPIANSISQANGNDVESPIGSASDGVYHATGSDADSNSDSSNYGSFMRQSTAKRTAHCELDGVTDYAYKGRVDDAILYQARLSNSEYFSFVSCDLSLGTGVYYLLPSEAALKGQREYENSFLGKLLRSYGDPEWYELHYNNRIGQIPKSELAIQRGSLSLSGEILHFPGCRFATMDKLYEDFESPVWRAKPWDEKYSSYCSQTWLDASLVEDTNGDMQLQYDDLPYTVDGNGLYPDIPNMLDHVAGTMAINPESVVHSVYMDYADGHEAITLDGICSVGSGTEASQFLTTTNPLFQSAVECNTDEYTDYSSGYPCSTGFVDYDVSVDNNIDRDGLYNELFTDMEIPFVGTASTVSMLFYLNDGILVSTGYRLDCSCSAAGCNGTDAETDYCNTDFFVDQNGFRDFGCDKLELEPILLHREYAGARCIILDGSIPTLLELV